VYETTDDDDVGRLPLLIVVEKSGRELKVALNFAMSGPREVVVAARTVAETLARSVRFEAQSRRNDHE
jgi:hypothetical protein